MTAEVAGASPAPQNTPNLAALAGQTEGTVTKAEDTTAPAQAPEAPKPGPPATKTEDAGRAGGPGQLRAELAGERDSRQAAEAERDKALTQLANVLKTLGIQADAPDATGVDPIETVRAAQEAAQEARREVALIRNIPRDPHGRPVADADSLLDSVAFRAKLSTLDPNDTAGIAAAVTEHVQRHPAAKVVPPAGAADAAAQGEPGQIRDMDSLIRGAR